MTFALVMFFENLLSNQLNFLNYNDLIFCHFHICEHSISDCWHCYLQASFNISCMGLSSAGLVKSGQPHLLQLRSGHCTLHTIVYIHYTLYIASQDTETNPLPEYVCWPNWVVCPKHLFRLLNLPVTPSSLKAWKSRKLGNDNMESHEDLWKLK